MSESVSMEPSGCAMPCFFFAPLCLTELEGGAGEDIVRESKEEKFERRIGGLKSKTDRTEGHGTPVT